MNVICTATSRSLVRPVVGLRPRAGGVSPVATRGLHVTSISNKKKRSTQNDGDADDFDNDEDLFASPSQGQPEAKGTRPVAKGYAEKLESRRSDRFQLAKATLMDHPAFAEAYTQYHADRGSNSSSARSQINTRRLEWMKNPKRALLVKMITLAGTRAELLEFIDIFKIYRQKGWHIDDLARIDFIGRCIHLKSPDIALALLYHRPIFGFDIPSLTSARALMKSLLSAPCPPLDADKAPLPEDIALPTETPLTHALLLANLFDMYALPPAEKDSVARALLLGASAGELKAGSDTENANTIIQRIQAVTESPSATPEGPTLDNQNPKVKDGKLVATSQALKERGKFTSEAAKAWTAPLYTDQLTTSERTWINRRLDQFIRWSQKQGQDVAWVDKLRVA
ncbi:hypothetical protein RHS04_06863 [Rhizoctonia solani]|uniref:Uncharacterized protein n=1 Tax=Rhizoctonia solani TaxID=456999 RepID=A0A8H7LFG3_9AGAM|nr:hypothetical protein RHS04_06863 [Rhizoctonia solani]